MKTLVFVIALLLASCRSAPAAATPPAIAASDATSAVTDPPTVTPQQPPYRSPAQASTWQIQYTGEIDLSLDVDVYNLDLFETAPAAIQDLHSRSVFVMCYFSGGSYEDWRPDIDLFPNAVLGDELDGWPGERWLDIRQVESLLPVMHRRLDQARQKGCDGVDPDNVDGYANETGFPLSYDDQLTYNRALAEAAHARGLSIGLKNDLEQIVDLLPYFDWALNEQCFRYGECSLLVPFMQAGKPVFNIEYELNAADFCAQARQLGFNSIRKNFELDDYVEPCGRAAG